VRNENQDNLPKILAAKPQKDNSTDAIMKLELRKAIEGLPGWQLAEISTVLREIETHLHRLAADHPRILEDSRTASRIRAHGQTQNILFFGWAKKPVSGNIHRNKLRYRQNEMPVSPRNTRTNGQFSHNNIFLHSVIEFFIFMSL
jgi:hypothetical protein